MLTVHAGIIKQGGSLAPKGTLPITLDQCTVRSLYGRVSECMRCLGTTKLRLPWCPDVCISRDDDEARLYLFTHTRCWSQEHFLYQYTAWEITRELPVTHPSHRQWIPQQLVQGNNWAMICLFMIYNCILCFLLACDQAFIEFHTMYNSTIN